VLSETCEATVDRQDRRKVADDVDKTLVTDMGDIDEPFWAKSPSAEALSLLSACVTGCSARGAVVAGMACMHRSINAFVANIFTLLHSDH
jgi:hypothetical protein